MSQKVVGITCGIEHRAGKPSRNAVNATYVKAIEDAGGIPLILPCTSSQRTLDGYLDTIDGLLLTGGVDINPALYKRKQHSAVDFIDDDRDETELPMVREALDRDMPILAICRGLQLLNVALGGTLTQDLPSERPSEIQHQQIDFGHLRSTPTHDFKVKPESKLAECLKIVEGRCNSMHHQALEIIGRGLIPTAWAPDGVIEGGEMPDKRYVVGVQYHPEDLGFRDGPSCRLFASFLAAL